MEFLKELYHYNGALRLTRIGDTLLVFFTIAGYFYMYQDKNEVVKKTLVFPAVFYTILVLNPLSSYILAFKLGFDTRMARFLWMFPMALVLGYVLIRLLEEVSPTWKKGFLVLFLLWITFFTKYKDTVSYSTENIFKVTDELLSVTELLHESGYEEGEIVFFENWNLYATVRQYDPSIRVAASWEGELDDIRPSGKGENYEELFLSTIQGRNIVYLVLYQETSMLSELEVMEYIGKTEKFKVYRIKAE